MSSRTGRRLSGGLLPLALALAAGCGGGDGLDREPISGDVTFDGKPLESGEIQFLPDPANPNPIMGGAPIKAGTYDIPRDEGLVPGKYTVRISSSTGETEDTVGEDNASMPGLGPIHPRELIPPQYNNETTLTAEVVADGENAFNYDLEK